MAEATASAGEPGGLARKLALGSIGIAFAVMALKFLAWWITGSVALYSDALESIVNVIAAAAALFAVTVAAKPADRDHQFGHHKAEYLSAVFEGVLIVVAALLILHAAATTLMAGAAAISEPGAGLAINMVAAAINAAWAWLLLKKGRALRSPALIADGHHIVSDVVTSVGVVAGLLLALATGWLVLDPLMAIIVALNVLWQGWKVINMSLQGLMDKAPEPDDLDRLQAVIASTMDGAIEYHDLKARVAGTAMFVDFHLVVPGAMQVETSHRICDRIEAAIRKGFPGSTIQIHVEPEHKAKHG